MAGRAGIISGEKPSVLAPPQSQRGDMKVRASASRIGLAILVAALLSLGACEALRHDRGSESCYCYNDVGGSSPATVGHKWKL
jgi:hypothetical protein